MSWKDLDIKLKAELIKLGVLSGIRDIKLIRLLYDDNNTPILVIDLSYNETNVKPLLGIERIVHDYGIPEEEVNKANDIIQLIEKEISLEEINNQLPVLFKLFNKGGYISNSPTLALVGKVKKYSEGGYENPDEPPVSESTYVELPPLNIYELELLNYLLSNPTAEQEYFRNLAVLNMTAPQSNLGVVLTKEEQTLVGKALLGYNNFRYSHPWAEGLSYTPIIGDGMDLISIAGDINNKNYISAGLGLGMLALPNFIEKPIKNYKKLRNRYKYYNMYYNNFFNNNKERLDFIEKIALKKYPDLSNPFVKSLARIESDTYKDLVHNEIEGIAYNTLSLYKNLNNKDYGRLANIINLSPEYGIFLQLNPTLNPLSLNTLDKFFERQSKSIRGVTANNDNIALLYLSTPPPQSIGGDRLSTKGLYTSNSFDIADAFSRSQVNSLQSSYIGKVQYPFKIDKLQSFENLLKLYRSYIDHYYLFGLNSRIPGTIAKEAVYVRGNGDHYYNITERSYYPKEENNKKIVDILELQNRGLLQNLHGRWGNSNMIPDSEYFIPKYPNNSLSDYITFMKAATKEGKFRSTDINEIKRWKEQLIINDIITNLEKIRGDLYIKAYNKYKKNIQKPLDNLYRGVVVSGAVTLPVLAGYLLSERDNSPNISDMSLEEYNLYTNLIDKVHNKTGIKKDKLYKMPLYKLLRYLKEEEYKNGGFSFPNLAFSHKFDGGGELKSNILPPVEIAAYRVNPPLDLYRPASLLDTSIHYIQAPRREYSPTIQEYWSSQYNLWVKEEEQKRLKEEFIERLERQKKAEKAHERYTNYLNSTIGRGLNAAQLGLSVAGLHPALKIPAEIVNTIISIPEAALALNDMKYNGVSTANALSTVSAIPLGKYIDNLGNSWVNKALAKKFGTATWDSRLLRDADTYFPVRNASGNIVPSTLQSSFKAPEYMLNVVPNMLYDAGNIIIDAQQLK